MCNSRTVSNYLNFIINDNIFKIVDSDLGMKINVVYLINLGKLKLTIDLKSFIFKYLEVVGSVRNRIWWKITWIFDVTSKIQDFGKN